MLRRQARERREYLYRKFLEEKHRSLEDRKNQVQHALDESKTIPTHLHRTALALQESLNWDQKCEPSVDDEYRWSGIEDPKIVITTSHDPSSRLKQFAKEVRLLLPNAQRMNRGNYETSRLVAACRANDVTDFVVLHETRGNPDGMIVCHLPYGPTARFTLLNAVLRHDVPSVGNMSEAYPHLVFHNFQTRLGRRVMSILKHLFPVPKEDSKRVVTFANRDDYISFRHHTYEKNAQGKVEVTEVGPRFEMKLYDVRLGTLEQFSAADVEWTLRPYTNTAKKRSLLGK